MFNQADGNIGRKEVIADESNQSPEHEHEHAHGYDDADQRLLYHAILHALKRIFRPGNLLQKEIN